MAEVAEAEVARAEVDKEEVAKEGVMRTSGIGTTKKILQIPLLTFLSLVVFLDQLDQQLGLPTLKNVCTYCYLINFTMTFWLKQIVMLTSRELKRMILLHGTQYPIFIGINIAISIISLPALDDYWSTDPILSHSWFRVIISCNRFREILRFVHVVDDTTAPSRTDPGYDKLWKVRPLLKTLAKTAPDLNALHQQESIDESMICTKCRLSFIQYMQKKPTKWGIKVWVCSDSITGCIYSFDVYTGANPSVPKHPKGQAYSVVMKLMESLPGRGHVVYTDNFYSSPVLFKDLLAKGTLASGTVRTNRRNFPKI